MKSLIDEKDAGGVMGFNIQSVAPRSDLADSQTSLQHFGVNSLDFDWTPTSEKKRKGVGKHEKTNKHEARHDGDDEPWFSGHVGDFSFHEKIWRESKCDTAPVPVPGAAWLLGSALIGLFSAARLKRGNVGRSSVV